MRNAGMNYADMWTLDTRGGVILWVFITGEYNASTSYDPIYGDKGFF